MITVSDVEHIIEGGESKNVEFKTSAANLKHACETLCAFLNGSGGTVLIGVKNNGDLTGQSITDQTRLEISNLIAKIEPPVSVEVEYLAIGENRKVIKMSVITNPSSIPYVFNGKPFWRIESSTRLMPQQRYQQLLMERANKLSPWEADEAIGINIDDLDQDEILNTISDCIRKRHMEARYATDDPREALRRLKLISNGQLINAAVILFCKDPLPRYSQCLLRMAKFGGSDKSNILDSQRIHAHAFDLLHAAEDFLMRHISIESEFLPGKMARLDKPEYPPRAVREALVNAITHRDYSILGGSISLLIYDNRLEITSHGNLPSGMTVDVLKRSHESQPRNERMAHVLYRRGVVESVGTGTQEIVKECKIAGLPEPEYIEQGNTFIVRFLTGVKEGAQMRQSKILALLRKHEKLKKSDILHGIDINITERTLRRDLEQLLQRDLIEMLGGGRSTMWCLKKNK